MPPGFSTGAWGRPTKVPLMTAQVSRDLSLEERMRETALRLVALATEDKDGCLISHLTPNKKGYCYVTVGRGLRFRAHRFVHDVLKEKIPDNLRALHSCDKRNCINTEHVYPGTDFDNTQDMLKRGRGGNQHQINYGQSYTNKHKRRK